MYRGCYYVLHDRGFLTCNDPATGKPIYPRQRISTDTATFTASPWAYNGKVFALSEDGDTYVFQAGPEFKVLGKNSLERDGAGDACGRRRQPDRAHRVEVVSNQSAVGVGRVLICGPA